MRLLVRIIFGLVFAVVSGVAITLILDAWLGGLTGQLASTYLIGNMIMSFVVFMAWKAMNFAFKGIITLSIAIMISFAVSAMLTSSYGVDTYYAYVVSLGATASIVTLITFPRLSGNGDEFYLWPFPIVVIYGLSSIGYHTEVLFRQKSISDVWMGISMTIFPLIPIYGAIILLAIGSFIKENPTMLSWFSFGRGAPARWSGVYSYLENTVQNKGGGLFLGSTLVQDTLYKYNVFLKKDDDAHHVTIAQTGAGKSITSLWPNLLSYRHPMVVLDPKGEHAEFSAKHRNDVYIFDPFNKVKSPDLKSRKIGYNPLDEIDIEASGARSFLEAISDACVFKEEGQNSHFSANAKTIIEGVLIHVLTRLPKEERTLPRLAEMFRGYDQSLGVSDPAGFDDVVADMSTNSACGGIAMDAAGILLAASDRERGSYLTTCFRSLKWINDPDMKKHLIGKSGHYPMKAVVRSSSNTTLYLVLPFEYMKEDSQIRWMRLLVNLLTVHSFRNPRSKESPLLFILDEFPRLGYMQSLVDGIVTARGAGLKYWILLQQVGQLKKLYSEDWETFLGSSNVQAFGISDLDTATWLAKVVGGEKDAGSAQYPLMRPDEVVRFLGKDDPTQVVVPVSGLPMRLERMAFKRIKRFRGMGR